MYKKIAEPGQQAELPFITVVVPALNEANFISDTLAQIAAQDYPAGRLEVLVVDGGSSDETPRLVREFCNGSPLRVELFQNPKRLSSAARNIGIQRARGEYVLFVDAHVFIPNRQVIAEMARAAAEEGARVLARPQPLNPPGLNQVQAAIAAVRASVLGHSGESYIYSDYEGWVSPLSVAVMYHRSVFVEHGLFDESFDAAEDVEFNYRLERAGVQAYLSPKFTIRYFPRPSFRGLFRQMERYGRGRINFTYKHPERFSAEIFVPCIASLGLVGAPILAGLIEALQPLLIGGGLVMSLLVMLLVARHLSGVRIGSLLLAPACLCVIHLGLASGVLKGLLSRAPDVLVPELKMEGPL